MRTTAPPRQFGRVVAVVAVVAGSAVLLDPDLLGLSGRLPFVAFVLVRPTATVLLGVLALVALAFRRRWWPVVTGVLVVVLVSAVMMAPRVVGSAAPSTGGRTLSLLSFNVNQGRADVQALASVLRVHRPDLVVLPESAQSFRDRIVAAVPELGYRSWVAAAPGADDVDGTTVLASPSVGAVDAHELTGSFDPWLELDGGALGTTRLIAVHAAAPVPEKIQWWPRELASLQRWCGRVPAVIAGDFNATLDHAAFRAGTRGCRDTGEAAGEGLVATWNAAWPRWFGAQIDHVLTTGGPATAGPSSSGLAILDLSGSDHRALLTRVELPASGA